jgi:hypothetical protein
MALLVSFKLSSKGDFLVQYGVFQCGVVSSRVCGHGSFCRFCNFVVGVFVVVVWVSPAYSYSRRGKEKKPQGEKTHQKKEHPNGENRKKEEKKRTEVQGKNRRKGLVVRSSN